MTTHAPRRYVNYDCSLYCTNLFERLIKYLAQQAYPDGGRVLTTHSNALDCLLTVVADIHERDDAEPSSNRLPTVEDLLGVRRKKLLLTEGVALFNEKPKKGIKNLQDNRILATGDTQFTEIAAFLRSEPRLDKRQIGEFISGREGGDVLSAFVKSFDLSDLPLDEALRSFLTTFRLPGESRLIERIFEEFAAHWFTTYTGEKVPKDTDCTFVLCYAVIQLNVDQHNPQVKNPMTIQQFRNNQRKLNDGEDFPPEFLEEIYENIKEREIVLPAEQKGAIGEDFKWQVMLGQAQNPKTRKQPYYRTAGSTLYDQEVFSQMWGPTVTALCCVLDKAEDPGLEARVLEYLRVCASIASAYHLCDVFDSLIVGMCKRIAVAEEHDDERHGSSIEDDDFTSHLGKTPKVQTTLKLLFRLIAEHGSILRHGWQDILDLIGTLFAWRLLPADMMIAYNFVNGGTSLNPAMVEKEATETSFFGQLLGLGGGSPVTNKPRSRRYALAPHHEILAHLTLPVSRYLELEEVARGAVLAAGIPQVFSESTMFEDASLQELVKSITFQARSEVAHKEIGNGLPYNETASIFFIELLTKVVIANKDRANLVWDPVQEHLSGLIVATERHPLVVEQALIAILRIGERVYLRDELAPLVIKSFTVLERLPDEVLHDCRTQIVAGLTSFIKVCTRALNSSQTVF